MSELDYHFSRESRLLTPKHFSFVFDQAVSAPSPSITILARHNNEQRPRLGITVPKKRVKHASDRNRIKRLIRESFRLSQHNLPNIDIIVIAKHGIGDLNNAELTKQIEKLWTKLTRRCNQANYEDKK